MRFGSVCSGIEAASVAWESLGWRAAWLSEIEAFPSAVLRHHWPAVPNLGDMTALPARLDSGEIEAPDVLVGGTPCQAFSVAGNRESLSDARGNLTLTFVELADVIDRQRARDGHDPCIIVWENVPGVLSTKDNAFGCFLAGLAGEDVPLLPPGPRWTNAGLVLGPKRAVAWRILDAQYFGVAQRRRRVFAVASARDGFDPSQILLEFDGVRRDTAPRRETGQGIAADAGGGVAGTGQEQPYHDVSLCLNAGGMGRIDYESESMVVSSVALRGRDGGATAELGGEVSTALRASSGGGDKSHVLAFASEVSPTLRAGGNATGGHRPPGTDADTADSNIVTASRAVRRLTPRECERLQGFPDDHTLVPYRGKDAADGPRYKALGNSMAVPVMAWIGRRIAAYVA